MRYYLIRDAEKNCVGIVHSFFILFHNSPRLNEVVGDLVTATEVSRSEYETYKAFGFKEYNDPSSDASKPL